MSLNSEKIKKYLTDTKNLNLAITRPKRFFKDYKKCEVFNKEIDEPLHKVWMKMPRVKTLSSSCFNNILNRDIPLGLAPVTKELKTFIFRIKKIESYIASELKMKHRSSFKKISDYMTVMSLRTPYADGRFQFKCYGPNNEEIDFKEVEKGEIMSAFIELTDVWIKDDEIGFNWSIYQAKVYQTFGREECLFDDEGPVQKPVAVNIPPPPPPNMPSFPLPPINNYVNTKKSETNTIVPKFVPTKEALLDMRQKLKKRDENKKEDINKEDIDFEISIMNAELDCSEFETYDKKINKEYEEILCGFQD